MIKPVRPIPALELRSVDQLAAGELPQPSTLARIVTFIVRRRPTGRDLEAAIREAALLGWRARHELELMKKEACNDG